MANLSEIIVRKNQNDEQWKAQKQAERENAAAMQDAGMEEISSNPDAYARYLEIQGDNPLYSAGNIALAMVQNPNITQFGTVERWKTLSIDLGTDTPDIYPEGSELTIAVRGDYYIVAPAAATVGQAVLCNPTTGAITFGDAGATNDTGWTVQTAGAKGDTIIISNHGLGYKPAATGS